MAYSERQRAQVYPTPDFEELLEKDLGCPGSYDAETAVSILGVVWCLYRQLRDFHEDRRIHNKAEHG
jgi:hypothetical protein